MLVPIVVLQLAIGYSSCILVKKGSWRRKFRIGPKSSTDLRPELDTIARGLLRPHERSSITVRGSAVAAPSDSYGPSPLAAIKSTLPGDGLRLSTPGLGR